MFLLDSRLVKLSFQGKCRNRIPCSFDPYPWRYFTGMRKLLITAILRSKAVVVYLRDIYIYTSLCTYWTNLYVRICIYNYNYIYTWCRLYKCIVWHMLKSDLPYMFLGGSSHQKKTLRRNWDSCIKRRNGSFNRRLAIVIDVEMGRYTVEICRTGRIGRGLNSS